MVFRSYEIVESAYVRIGAVFGILRLSAELSRVATTGLEIVKDGLGLGSGHYGRQRSHVRLLHGLQAAEVFQQAAGRGFSDAGDFS